MELIAKIEIIANSVELEKIVDGLNNGGVTSFTVIRKAMGSGWRGAVSDDLEASDLNNIYVIAVCPKEQVNKVAELITPTLKKFGGICYVSDVQMIFGDACFLSDAMPFG